MRQCEIKDIKLYQARTKVIALGWYWVTMIFFCQINPKIHGSPGIHNVQVITKILSYKSVKASWKWTIFCSFMVQFLLITCFCSHISIKNKLQAHTLNTKRSRVRVTIEGQRVLLQISLQIKIFIFCWIAKTTIWIISFQA